MHRFFVDERLAQKMRISGEDAHHIAKVLRLGVGERIQLVDSGRVTALMEISAVTAGAVFVHLISILETSNEPSVRIFLAQGLPKADKMDFIVQKNVELGVAGIIPLCLERCVVRLASERAAKKIERWQKIAQEAAKQSKRDFCPTVGAVQNLRETLAGFDGEILLAYEGDNLPGLRKMAEMLDGERDILLVIGPEGGFSPTEISLAQECGAGIFSLGGRILRTETAGLATISALLYATGNLGG